MICIGDEQKGRTEGEQKAEGENGNLLVVKVIGKQLSKLLLLSWLIGVCRLPATKVLDASPQTNAVDLRPHILDD